MRYTILTLLLISIGLQRSYSQENDDSQLFKRLILRQSFQSKNDKALPARGTYTNPANTPESWLIDAAIGIQVLEAKNAVITLSPYYEIHRNTLIDKVQNNWQAGLAFEWHTQNIKEHNWTPVIIGSSKYYEDNVQSVNSLQGNIYATPQFKGRAFKTAYFWIPNIRSRFGKILEFTYSPYIGFENENRIATEEATDQGDIYRVALRVTSSIMLLPGIEKWHEKFEFTLDWQYRNSFSENVESLEKRTHEYFSAGFNVILFSLNDGNRNAKIGIDYIKGEDPTKNFDEQSYYAITLKVKL